MSRERSTFHATIGDAGTVFVTVLDDDEGLFDLTGYQVTFRATHRITGDQFERACTPDPDQVANMGRVSVTLLAADLDPADRTPGEHNVEWDVHGASFVGTWPSRDRTTGYRDTLILEAQDG
jgi:hypothetical protein